MDELPHVADADDRRKLERKIGNANGEVWKTKGDNKMVVAELMRVAKKIAANKEVLHKAGAKVKKDKEKKNTKAANMASQIAADALPVGVQAAAAQVKKAKQDAKDAKTTAKKTS